MENPGSPEAEAAESRATGRKERSEATQRIDELRERMDTYLGEFEQHGTDNITVDMEE